MSACSAAASGLFPISASCSFIRVSGVRRSCETPASMSVRWTIMRCILSRMMLNSDERVRISVAPAGLMSPGSLPLPKSTTAVASRRIGRTWLRMNTLAMTNMTSDVPTIQKTNR